ncbi:tRNA 2-thiouridine(34) synthase MnmA [Treponema sp. OMZ 799]|uniref:tRNA 2-thiouridine(34) synthase MnmA n=1 Tax=Treponema sp. OMZ 799 TaxID=2563668 RepID=UPI0020A26722|nr:tRNA 2-thiouridine(34) synthase MnmA [Treponema sp. OMZ 799]UTC79139.1 tRNA 2-thiouridine(34) synthase MnmA [Treponema sp. OMZ 799]
MKVLAGLSGGVDSAVAAKLLIDQGYEVTGVTMKLLPKLSGIYKEQTDDIEDAKKVAAKLGIKHMVYDMRETFKTAIIDYFVEEYKEGRTPNPCFICNSKIKFGLFLEQALKDGFDKIATGHYAKIEKTEIEGEERFLLKQAKDSQKDQSYFLALLNQKQLSRSIFPLGDFTKEKVRCMAEEAGLINAHRPDSQDICFVPDDDYTRVINALAKDSFKEGKFVDTQGKEIGRHKGLQYYTIGQRRGLAIAMGYPVYVVKKDAQTNTVTVGKDEELFAESLIASNVNIISKKLIYKEIDIEVKTRYRQQKKKAKLIPLKTEDLKPTGKFKVEFLEPEKAVAEGQAAVFYDRDYIIGGGIIESVKRPGIL